MRSLTQHRRFCALVCVWLAASLLWAGCSSSGPLTFAETVHQQMFTMTRPSVSGDLYHEDETIVAQFIIDQGACLFQIQNVSADPIELLWDRASLSLDGVAHGLRMFASYYAEDPLNTALVLPSLGVLSDLVLPADHLVLADDQWHELALLPQDGTGETYLGGLGGGSAEHTIDLTLPVRTGGTDRIYQFQFVTVGAQPRSGPAVLGRPALPSSRKESPYDQYVTAGVVVGFGVLLAVMLQSNKSNPIPE